MRSGRVCRAHAVMRVDGAPCSQPVVLVCFAVICLCAYMYCATLCCDVCPLCCAVHERACFVCYGLL